MEQETMKVKCPNTKCGAIITIPNTPGIADRMLTCPICKRREKVAVFIEEINKPQQNDLTEVCLTETEDNIGKLVVNGKWYSLIEGRNIIGRMSPTSMADIQLNVDDMHMSRSHVCISVINKTKCFEHRIENITSNNKVFINGSKMDSGEILVLNYGDVIRIGKTDIQFVR